MSHACNKIFQGHCLLSKKYSLHGLLKNIQCLLKMENVNSLVCNEISSKSNLLSENSDQFDFNGNKFILTANTLSDSGIDLTSFEHEDSTCRVLQNLNDCALEMSSIPPIDSNGNSPKSTASGINKHDTNMLSRPSEYIFPLEVLDGIDSSCNKDEANMLSWANPCERCGKERLMPSSSTSLPYSDAFFSNDSESLASTPPSSPELDWDSTFDLLLCDCGHDESLQNVLEFPSDDETITECYSTSGSHIDLFCAANKILKKPFRGFSNDCRNKKMNKQKRVMKEDCINVFADNLRPNFFLAIPVTNAEVHDKAAALQANVQGKKPALSPALIPVATLHLTVMVMTLSGDDQLESAKEALTACSRRIREEITLPIDMHIQNIGHFKHNVVFAQVKNDAAVMKLRSLAVLVQDVFLDYGITSTDGKGFAPHITLMKLSRSPKLRKKGIKKIHADLYSDYTSCHFGKETASLLQLCAMLKPKDLNGYYHVESQISLECDENLIIDTNGNGPGGMKKSSSQYFCTVTLEEMDEDNSEAEQF